MPVRSFSLRILGGVLTLLLITMLGGFCPLFPVKNVSAKSACLVFLMMNLCPSPTPALSPSPTTRPGLQTALVPTPRPTPLLTPTPRPFPEPTPTAGQTSGAVPTPSLTVETSASPTVTLADSKDTPVPDPTRIASLMEWHGKNQKAAGQSTSFPILVITLLILLFLFVALGIGLFFFFRTLLSPIDTPVPSSDTDVWSLTGEPRAFVGRPNKKKRQ